MGAPASPAAPGGRRGLRRRGRRGAVSGHSYMEMTASLFVIATALLPMLGLMVRAQKVGRQAQVCTAAANAARQEMETLRALPPAARPATPGEVPFALPAAVTSRFPHAALEGTYRVADAAPGGLLSPGLQQIVVTVRWRSAAGSTAGGSSAPRSEVRLDTLVAQEGTVLL